MVRTAGAPVDVAELMEVYGGAYVAGRPRRNLLTGSARTRGARRPASLVRNAQPAACRKAGLLRAYGAAARGTCSKERRRMLCRSWGLGKWSNGAAIRPLLR